MKIRSILLLIGTSLLAGCSSLIERQPDSPAETSAESPSQQSPASGFDEFNRRDSTGDFSKSAFVVNDFMNVVQRVPRFVPGVTRFSSALPRTRYGEILLEQLRLQGFAIVLGNSQKVPPLLYSIELPGENSPDVYTFFLSLGDLELKRSYEIFGERIAPVSEMLMAGIDPDSLRPLNALDALPSEQNTQEILGVQRINELVSADENWDPLDVNLYDTKESVYEPMFADAITEYENVSRQVLVFPNDSLVLGNENKNYLFDLATRAKNSEDVVRIVGCSHGKSQLSAGNEKLAKGRAIRVREELLLAGMEASAVLHEACWASEHYDEKFPRRGVVVLHLRPLG